MRGHYDGTKERMNFFLEEREKKHKRGGRPSIQEEERTDEGKETESCLLQAYRRFELIGKKGQSRSDEGGPLAL